MPDVQNSKNENKPTDRATEQRILKCWEPGFAIIHPLYEIQAGKPVYIGSFNLCIRRFLPQISESSCEWNPPNPLDYALADCPLCRREASSWPMYRLEINKTTTTMTENDVRAYLREALDENSKTFVIPENWPYGCEVKKVDTNRIVVDDEVPF